MEMMNVHGWQLRAQIHLTQFIWAGLQRQLLDLQTLTSKLPPIQLLLLALTQTPIFMHGAWLWLLDLRLISKL
jgi:hypothetical protein